MDATPRSYQGRGPLPTTTDTWMIDLDRYRKFARHKRHTSTQFYTLLERRKMQPSTTTDFMFYHTWRMIKLLPTNPPTPVSPWRRTCQWWRRCTWARPCSPGCRRAEYTVTQPPRYHIQKYRQNSYCILARYWELLKYFYCHFFSSPYYNMLKVFSN